MKKFLYVHIFITIILVVFYFHANLYSQISNQKCLICHSKPDFSIKHGDGSVKSLYVNENDLKSSPHYNISCYDCHNDIVEITALGHTKDIKKVECTRCHYEGNLAGAPNTEKYREFQESVHQAERMKGNLKAPVCQTCHGTHNIKSRDSFSPIDLKKNITRICGQCHLDIYTEYSTSVHGKALLENNIEGVPVCTDCHGEHTIKKHDDPGSSVFSTKVYSTCGGCHGSEQITEQYNIKSDQFRTYESSYHGIAVQFGEKTVANCASCHGVHNIKKQDDPASTIHANNIVKTCGKCHPDANANYTKGKIHLNPNSAEAGSIYYISGFFKWLTILTLSFLAIHVMLDLIRKLKHKKAIRQEK
jgi:DnaJ-class molecular chaperone